MATEDSAIVVRAKFTARPTATRGSCAAMAYDKIIKAFRNAGIKFAHSEVTVFVPPSQDTEFASSAAGAAAAIESAGREKGKLPQA